MGELTQEGQWGLFDSYKSFWASYFVESLFLLYFITFAGFFLNKMFKHSLFELFTFAL